MDVELAAPPAYMQIEPVGQCNLRCRMCPIQFRRDGLSPGPAAFIDFDLFTRLIDQAGRLEELHLQGLGEPLMHPRFFEMVRYAADRGIRVSTNSNLTLLTERRARECVDSGLHAIHVSLDGATPDTFEYVRVRARFDRVLRNLRRLLDARAHNGGGPEISLVAVTMRRNLAELPELVRLAHRLGVEWLYLQHLCHDFSEDSLPAQYRPMRDFVERETLVNEDPRRVAAVLDEVRALGERLGVKLRIPRLQPQAQPPPADGRARCSWPWHGPYVSYAGDAMPCCMVGTPDRVRLGDLARDDLDSVWNGAAYREFRRRLASAEPPAVCRGCAVYAGTF
ncbi:MAG: radical SAM protein [Gammaproteobacteria bacterium]